jgi:hypothetical protein
MPARAERAGKSNTEVVYQRMTRDGENLSNPFVHRLLEEMAMATTNAGVNPER